MQINKELEKRRHKAETQIEQGIEELFAIMCGLELKLDRALEALKQIAADDWEDGQYSWCGEIANKTLSEIDTGYPPDGK